jgi:hypothetical protein
MRLFALLVALCAMSPPAEALTFECKAIPNAGARLACYDKANSPAASVDKPAAAKPAAAMPAAKADAAQYVDTIGAEDARMNAQLKNICRGC